MPPTAAPGMPPAAHASLLNRMGYGDPAGIGSLRGTGAWPCSPSFYPSSLMPETKAHRFWDGKERAGRSRVTGQTQHLSSVWLADGDGRTAIGCKTGVDRSSGRNDWIYREEMGRGVLAL